MTGAAAPARADAGRPRSRRPPADRDVVGLAGWLIRHPQIDRVVARNVAADNTPSRRALERAGFVLEDDDGVHAAYAFTRG